MNKKKTAASKHAKALSKLGASKGGKARAAKLTKEQRSEVAREAAKKRWDMPKETHTGIIQLGEGIPCSVLSNRKRVLSVSGLFRAFGSGAKSRVALPDGTPVPEFLAGGNIQQFASGELRSKLTNVIEFRSVYGGRAIGYDADILTLICDCILDARAAGVLRPNQMKIAMSAEVLVRAFAKVGVIALIDEATGYQADRASDELQRLVAAYVVEDMRPWVRLFPDTFFRQVYRIHGWKYQAGVTQGPRYVGKFINRYVYERLPPAVLEKLRELNPVVGSGRRHKHFQFLSEDFGEPTIDRHLASVTTLMTVAKDKDHFKQLFAVAFPRPGDQLTIPGVLSGEQVAGVEVDKDDIDGVEVIEIVASPRERILAALRAREGAPASFYELSFVAYDVDARGNSLESTRASKKLGRLLGRMRDEGLIESPSRQIWRLVDAPE